MSFNTRRTSTGSLMSRKRTNTSSSHDPGSMGNGKDYNSMISGNRKGPITGGSWDDNSVGHGSVAARMRRERNLAIRRTQPNSTYSWNARDTQASITSTLNLINTTALSPWSERSPFPWDEGYDNGCYNNQSAASKKTAGSLCNITSSDSRRNWDSRSIPDYQRHPQRERVQQRLSFSTGQHHSSPTSGCASIASSDIDSADQAFFSMTDDSSYFDGDSLFSDSYGMFEGDSGFSTNIFSLLEEGSIICRTPFPNEDWPDSISELDFDCNVPQSDISNCDAHSDIGPSCSAATDRNKLKKRHVRSPSVNTGTDEYSNYNEKVTSSMEYNVVSNLTEVLRRQIEVGVNANLQERCTSAAADIDNMRHSDGDEVMMTSSPNHASFFSRPSDSIMSSDKKKKNVRLKKGTQDDMSIEQFFVKTTKPCVSNPSHAKPGLLIPPNDYLLYARKTETLPKRENLFLPNKNNHTPSNTYPEASSMKFTLNLSTYPCPTNEKLTGANNLQKSDLIYPTLNPLQSLQMQVDSIGEGKMIVRPCSPTETPVKKQTPKKIAPPEKQHFGAPVTHKMPSRTDLPTAKPSSAPKCVKDWNLMTKDERLGFIEQLSQKIATTMGLQEQMDIIQIIGSNKSTPINCIPFSMSIDDIDSHKLARVLGYMGSHQNHNILADSKHSIECGFLRRSNSDGNLAKTIAEAKDKQRKDQRQARRFGKWLKQRQRKENRQHKKEQKSGLFVMEQKLKLEIASEEEIDIDI